MSFSLNNLGVAPTILHLMQCAIVANANNSSTKKDSSASKPGTSRKDREKSDDSAAEALFEEANCYALVGLLNEEISNDVLACFVKIFLLETNSTNIRWQAHALILAIYK